MITIAQIAAEAAPWCKTGGLGDVAGALPDALIEAGRERGEEVEAALFLPLYRAVRQAIDARGLTLIDTGVEVTVPFGLGPERARFLRIDPGEGLAPVFLLDAPARYDRPRLYDDEHQRPYHDNLHRYALLCRAALEAAPRLLGRAPDIIHAHDWQGALAPVYLKTRYQGALPSTAAVFTIHNLAYQGLFAGELRHTIDLDPGAFHMDALEYHGALNLLKGGVAFADATTTVSRSYAAEICTPQLGCGLDGFLRARARRLTGVVNGVDTRDWDPATDPALAENYDPKNMSGKAACRAALLAELGLSAAPEEPVLAIVSRFTAQKGLDLVAELVPHLHALGARLVVLGSGDAALEAQFRYLGEVYGHHLATRVGFDLPLSRRIYAGADILLMPSRFEPCGLNQLYAMRYGAVPVVHAVGGLRDTVDDPGDAALTHGEGTGFRFEHPTAQGLYWALGRAVRMFREQPSGWRQLVATCMARDVSWAASASTYLELYRALLR
ncbi:MAG: glycogen synthase GlgA [Myxococcales bacterium]|nr:glycogen synthase GlgA [Myxococcales bacterium]